MAIETNTIDWNGKLHVVNGSPLSTPYPTDRVFWIVTVDGEAHEVAYSHEHRLYTGRETYCRVDGEPGSWEPDEIAGWTDSFDDADEAADRLSLLLAYRAEAAS